MLHILLLLHVLSSVSILLFYENVFCFIGGTPPEILNNTEMMQLFLPALKADYTMLSQLT
jgi:hypothetical protein